MSRQLDHYCDALFPKPYRVLGLELKPFCLSHLFRMREFGCPFASDDPEQMGSPADLQIAVLICSRTHEEFDDFLRGKEVCYEHWYDTPVVVWEWLLDRVTGTNQSVRWLRKWDKKVAKAFDAKKLDAFEQFFKFQDYRRQGLYAPKVFYEGGERKPSGSHWSTRLFQILTSQLGYTESKALNMPLARVLTEYYLWREANGTATFMDDFEIAVAEGEVRQ
jgi:hypothetical protein